MLFPPSLYLSWKMPLPLIMTSRQTVCTGRTASVTSSLPHFSTVLGSRPSSIQVKKRSCFYFCFYCITPCGKFGSSYPGKAPQLPEQCYPFLSERAVFLYPTICRLCVCVNKEAFFLILHAFGSCFRTLAVIPFSYF